MPTRPLAEKRRPLKSYSSERSGVRAAVREASSLYRLHSRDVAERVERSLSELRHVEDLVAQRFGVRLEGQRVLDIGSGQYLTQLAYFARRNDAVGIDLDMIVRGANPLPYLRMLRVNGARRTTKTVARKLLGLDARYSAELVARLGIERLPPLTVRQMDASQMAFADESFDFVYCRSVFHCLPDPGAAINEVARVLAPRGVAYITFQPYTNEMGSLDPRLLAGDGVDVPLWAHLRPRVAGQVAGNAYVNGLRLADWRKLFATGMPGAEFVLNQPHRGRLEQAARQLQAGGELLEYSVDELVTHDVIVLWQKPDEPRRS